MKAVWLSLAGIVLVLGSTAIYHPEGAAWGMAYGLVLVALMFVGAFAALDRWMSR